MDCNDINVMLIAQELQQYLHEHPYAADTVEGITRWWLFNQNVEVSHSLVQQALDILVLTSVVSVNKRSGGDAIYTGAVIEPNDHKK